MPFPHSSKDALCSHPLPGNDLIRERTFPMELNAVHKFKSRSPPYGLGGLNNVLWPSLNTRDEYSCKKLLVKNKISFDFKITIARIFFLNFRKALKVILVQAER